MWRGAKVSGLRRPFECVVILAAALARLGPAERGEIRGRILIGERPAPGVTSARSPTSPLTSRRAAGPGRRSRWPRWPRPPRAETAPSRLPSPPRLASRYVSSPRRGVVPSWMGGTYDAAESDDLGEPCAGPRETLAGRVVSATALRWRGRGHGVARGAAGRGDAESPAARTVITARGRRVSARASRVGTTIGSRHRAFLRSATIPNVGAGPCRGPSGSSSAPSLSGVSCHDRKTPRRACWCGSKTGGLETPWVEAGADGRFQLMDLPARRGRSSPKGGTPAWARRRRFPCRRRRTSAHGRAGDRPRRSRARPSTQDARARAARGAITARTATGRARTARAGRPQPHSRAPPAAAVPFARRRARYTPYVPPARAAHHRRRRCASTSAHPGPRR